MQDYKKKQHEKIHPTINSNSCTITGVSAYPQAERLSSKPSSSRKKSNTAYSCCKSIAGQMQVYRKKQYEKFHLLSHNTSVSTSKSRRSPSGTTQRLLAQDLPIHITNNWANRRPQQQSKGLSCGVKQKMQSKNFYRSQFTTNEATYLQRQQRQQLTRLCDKTGRRAYSRKSSRGKYTNNQVTYQQRQYPTRLFNESNHKTYSQDFFREQPTNNQTSSWLKYLEFVSHTTRS